MLFWTIKITVISIIFIFLVHYLINFFKSVLTVPKIKDLVNSPNKKYESMYNTIKNYERNKSSEINSNESSSRVEEDYTLIDLLPQTNENKPTMKNELKNFLKKQLHTQNESGTNISSLDLMSNTDSFSLYNENK
jgi:cell shape-determining protein MreC